MKIKWIFFDIGNVLCKLDFESVWESFIDACNVPIEKIKDALYDEYLFNSFECGRLDPEEYYRGVIKKIGCNLDYKHFIKIWNSIIIKSDKMFKLVNDLRHHFNILILSNTNVLNASVIDKDIRDISDKIVYSYEVGYMKPDPEIFKIALDSINEIPKNVLFVDDLIENILAAKHLGFNTYLFDNYDNFKRYVNSNLLPHINSKQDYYVE